MAISKLNGIIKLFTKRIYTKFDFQCYCGKSQQQTPLKLRNSLKKITIQLYENLQF